MLLPPTGACSSRAEIGGVSVSAGSSSPCRGSPPCVGQVHDPCTDPLQATTGPAHGARTVRRTSACNPAPAPAPGGRPRIDYPGLYTAASQSRVGATWLQVDAVDPAGPPVVSESLGPAWGYHVDDVNPALGNLVADVAAAEATYSVRH